MRRCGVDTKCVKCGRNIPKGTGNFYYNPRNREEGKSCADCNKDVWWNPETLAIDKASDFQSYELEILSKINGKCHVCGKPTVAGITKVSPCNDGINWRHTYCTERDSDFKFDNSPTRSLDAERPTVKPVENVTRNGNEKSPTLSPITQTIWNEIEPLVQRKGETVDVSKQMSEVMDLIESCSDNQSDIKDMMALLREQLQKRPTESLEIRLPDETVITLQSPHTLLKTVLRQVNSYFRGKRIIPYLHGPAGSGKTTIAMQVAEAMKLDFHTISLNRQSTPTVILGFKDAMGQYQGTPYSEAWVNGGIILIDEFDNASGNLLSSLNTGWANDVMTFPHGQFKKHADCILICAGNTCGRGADRQYNERQQLDAATLDRIIYLNVPYDETVELNLALAECAGAENWVKYVQRVRANAVRTGVRIVISPRASYYGAALLKTGFSLEEITEMVLRKGLDADTWGKIK